ncbi:MAG: DUF2490 domain-containing protein [Myxococcota bacterium]
MRPLRTAFLALSLLLCAAGVAQAGDRSEGAVWIVNQAAVPLGNGLSFHGMVQNRFTGDADVYQRTVLRPWLAWNLPHGFELAVGYDAHLFAEPRSFAEQRGWQRIAYRYDFGGFRALTHLWLEERFFPGESTAFRMRWAIEGAVDLPYETAFVLRNEFFFDLNPTSRIPARKFGEDQLVAQLQHRINPWLRADVGYLMQFLDGGDDDLYNHTFTAGFAVTLPGLGANGP